ncbi:hypothetical protein Misp01_38510 [Microtetraspora sp. NBRC 13810]|uniref:hypothetical protein n=1 Tax=Microtetraspora sp. NBRC 13810 TaxID=3030990 RepID=UPI0024A16AF6|nr:hypothetical protein [Microtetraspora sp. NBRC 13810]GLW08721.1 hypothetical protein Misp01_38510 [Microtetraspora sp. NBRC 13810]
MPTAPEADHDLARLYGDKQPGRILVAVTDAALPITPVTAEVLAQERKPLPVLDEFVLRLVKKGVNTSSQISALLGLPEALVHDALADQFSQGTLRYARLGAKILQLTPAGERMVTEVSEITPIRRDLDLYFDRLSWRLIPCDKRDLLNRHQATDHGLIILPADPDWVISKDDDITPAVLNNLLKLTGDEGVEVITVKKIREGKPRYLQVKLLIYADTTGTDIVLSMVVNDELSKVHEHALARLDAVTKLNIRVEQPAEHPPLDAELERQRIPVEPTSPAELSPSPPRATTPASPPGPVQAPPQNPAMAGPPPTLEVRGISVFEHPALLNTALTIATTRILLIVPWVRRSVVNTDFISKLESRLRRGVRVHIAHGYEDDLPDPDADRKLKNLARRFPDKLTYTRIINNHAKVFIFDNIWVSTSFNWLSFRGDSDRTFRREEGTLVRSRTITDAQYDHFVQVIQDDAIG